MGESLSAAFRAEKMLLGKRKSGVLFRSEPLGIVIAVGSLVLMGAGWSADVLEPRDANTVAPVAPSTGAPLDRSAEKSLPESVHLFNADFTGDLFVNQGQAMSGFRYLASTATPWRTLFSTAGLNFEHVFNGVAADNYRNTFTPRVDPCYLVAHSETSDAASAASLVWPSASSSWNMDCQMDFVLSGGNSIDITFQATPRQDHFGLGYAGFMWASYMAGAKSRDLYFFGTRDQHDLALIRFGREYPNGPRGEVGVIGYRGAPPLPFEPDSRSLDIRENEHFKFVLPFFYGLMDLDGNACTEDSPMAFMMMFDQAEPVRFTLWNWSSNTHGPAWDWNYIARHPKVGETCGYAARVVYKPNVNEMDLLREYVRWVKRGDMPQCTLRVTMSPPEAGAVFPGDIEGVYAVGRQVFFGAVSKPGWQFDHWEGSVHDATQAFTGTTMAQDQTLTAMFLPAPQTPNDAWDRSPTSWTELLADRFDGGRSDNWQQTGGWSVVEQEPGYALHGVGSGLDVALLSQGSTWCAYRFSARVKVTGTAGLLFRRNVGGQYVVEINPGAVVLQRVLPGPSGFSSALASAAPVDPSTWHDLAIAGIQNELKVYADGALIMSYSDPYPLVDGGIGFGGLCSGSEILVKDVRVDRPVYSSTEPSSIDGTWSAPDASWSSTYTIAKGCFSHTDGAHIQGVCFVDETAKPPRLDVFVETESSAYTGRWIHGIYQREGNWLLLAQNTQCDTGYPSNFDVTPDTLIIALRKLGSSNSSGSSVPFWVVPVILIAVVIGSGVRVIVRAIARARKTHA